MLATVSPDVDRRHLSQIKRLAREGEKLKMDTLSFRVGVRTLNLPTDQIEKSS